MKDTRFYVPKRLFSWDTNPKTIKGQQHGFKTAVLYMAPSDMAGVGDFCPMARKANCRDACLYKAGRGGVHQYPACPHQQDEVLRLRT